MNDDTATSMDAETIATEADALPPKVLTPAAQRALAEADQRRVAHELEAQKLPAEFQGPKGPEPTRYGDWETKGIVSDF